MTDGVRGNPRPVRISNGSEPNGAGISRPAPVDRARQDIALSGNTCGDGVAAADLLGDRGDELPALPAGEWASPVALTGSRSPGSGSRPMPRCWP